MNQKQHEKACEDKYGAPWPEVHQHLDQYFDLFRSRTHRLLLHHKRGVELIVKEYGEEARGPAEQHIIIDWGFLPNSWLELDEYCCPVNQVEEDLLKSELEKLYNANLP